ncbi:hypothetical protein L3Y34_009613 [Caenorhabditis briggsae]|uniref:BTB domain-containing protein n=1 Tax=Caenorhabditis briggsae TaxID=6238 RepID=A0AAE9D4F8_CAEBR|nr:hypothetical protein L3Y34_009613 [Caenorhabditis briggsae]
MTSINSHLIEKINFYKTRSALRELEICTNSDSIFVNLNYLAELSEYFYVLRTGSYAENASQKLILDDVFTEELVQFLLYVCPDGFRFNRKINEQNILSLLFLSDRLMFPWVKEEVLNYLKNEEFQNTLYDTELLIQLCYLLKTQAIEPTETDPVFQKIANLKKQELVDEVLDSIPDSDVKSYMNKRIKEFRPYTCKPRPQIFFNWDDNFSHLYDN